MVFIHSFSGLCHLGHVSFVGPTLITRGVDYLTNGQVKLRNVNVSPDLRILVPRIEFQSNELLIKHANLIAATDAKLNWSIFSPEPSITITFEAVSFDNFLFVNEVLIKLVKNSENSWLNPNFLMTTGNLEVPQKYLSIGNELVETFYKPTENPNRVIDKIGEKRFSEHFGVSVDALKMNIDTLSLDLPLNEQKNDVKITATNVMLNDAQVRTGQLYFEVTNMNGLVSMSAFVKDTDFIHLGSSMRLMQFNAEVNFSSPLTEVLYDIDAYDINLPTFGSHLEWLSADVLVEESILLKTEGKISKISITKDNQFIAEFDDVDLNAVSEVYWLDQRPIWKWTLFYSIVVKSQQS